MSHFLVAVVGEDVKKQLQPYHEYECDGNRDEYVKLLDVTDKMREQYDTRMITICVSPEGERVDRRDEQFWRELTEDERKECGDFVMFRLRQNADGTYTEYRHFEDSHGIRSVRAFALPEGWSEMTVPYSELCLFKEFLLWDGFKEMDGDVNDDEDRFFTGGSDVLKVYQRTNPNKKWDGWTPGGGRWRSDLKFKNPEQVHNLEKKLVYDDTVYVKSDYDFEGMREAAAACENACWDRVEPHLPEHAWEPWVSVRERFGGDTDGARDFYQYQDGLKFVRKACGLSTCFSEDKYITSTREAEVERARNNAIPCHVILKDGQWHEQVQFGTCREVVSDRDWFRMVNETIDALPDDAILTFVDCHI